MKKVAIKSILISMLILGISISMPKAKVNAITQNETRATWIATVYNIDWPKTVDPKQELCQDLDLLQKTGFNTVYFQVRSMGDALYPTTYAPWSKYLTGTLGKDPGYDPLAFAISESKKRNLQMHAWFNPFRISADAAFDKTEYLSKLPDGNMLKNNPQWIVSYGNYSMINPGIPEARAYVIQTIMDVVNRYDIAGVQIDDYFYPSGCDYSDANEYTLYNNGMTLEDWRRDNVNRFVQDLSSAIKSSKKDVQFGISPFGIWKNAVSEGGSNTTGTQSYYATYSDSLKWVKNNWVDYIVPQVYWKIGDTVADFDRIVKWWNEAVRGTNVNLIIGQAAYKIGAQFSSSDEIINQINMMRTLDNVKGQSIYSFTQIKEDRLGLRSKLDNLYNGNMSPVINKGWVLNQGVWYYFDVNTGVMKTGWMEYNGRWYYLQDSGRMSTGWVLYNSKWYYMNSSGEMKTGWVLYNSKWYYMDLSGAMSTGWIVYNGRWYYCYTNGNMATNTRIGNYRIGSNGVWIQ